jgi:uncharacterized protein DUF222/HNH endonuclease
VPKSSLRLAARALRDALLSFDPSLCSGEDCAALAEELASTENACAAARARAALRAASCGAHKDKGFADGTDWLARASGTSSGQAREAMETAKAVEDLPRTRAAMEEGELSLGQAQEIARTEKECPGSETEMLDLAKRESLRTLRERGRKRRQEAIDPDELHDRQRRARRFRHWRDDLGMVTFTGALPPEVGIPIVNRLDAETDRIRRPAASRDESREAHAADALVKLLTETGRGKSHSADLVIVCDLRAYRRGHAHPGEPCHILGGGPVSVSLVRDLSADAFLKAALHDGVRIDTVVHFGRHVKAELRTALELGAPPDFDGVSCVQCDRRHGLQWDHVDPRANRGPTSYENLQPLCWPHHQEKTERDRTAGLLGRAPPGTGLP